VEPRLYSRLTLRYDALYYVGPKTDE